MWNNRWIYRTQKRLSWFSRTWIVPIFLCYSACCTSPCCDALETISSLLTVCLCRWIYPWELSNEKAVTINAKGDVAAYELYEAIIWNGLGRWRNESSKTLHTHYRDLNNYYDYYFPIISRGNLIFALSSRCLSAAHLESGSFLRTAFGFT